jgi:hypothetical protein
VKVFKNDDMHAKNNETEQGTALLLTARQVSWIVSGFFLLCFFIFMAGYFLGQRSVVTDFTNKVEQESLGDSIFASLYSLNNATDTDASEDDYESPAIETTGIKETLAALIAQDDAAQAWQEMDVETANDLLGVQVVEEGIKNNETTKMLPIMNYYAELIGFGTLKSAHAFVDKLQKQGIVTLVKERVSKTVKGKRVVWYQVVTEPCGDQMALLELVKRLEKKEHLKDVHIQTC